MDFDFSQEQRLLQETARSFFKSECPIPRVRALMAGPTSCDDRLWSALAEQGWTGMTLPEDVGGLALDLVDLCVVAEEMGRACLPGPFFSNFWASALLEVAGTAAQRKPVLEAIAAGEKRATVCWLEPAADWKPESIALTAAPDGDGVRLTGRKVFVTDAAAADLLLTVVRHSKGFAVALVPASAKGVTIRDLASMDETRKLADVHFEGVSVKASDLLAVASADDLERANDQATVVLCAELVGVMQLLMEMSIEYAKSRQQFDKPIGSFQGVQHQCADMLLYTESARSAAFYAAWALGTRDASASQAAAIAKAYCSEAGRLVGNHACQVHGGIGFTWEHDLHLYYKRTKLAEVLLGSPTYHRERVADMILASK
jgi:alkylation response protein AidB-like acyl-CoA dehydrogenase